MPVDVKLVVSIAVDGVDEVAAQTVLRFLHRNAVAQDDCDKAQNESWRHNQPQRLRPIRQRLIGVKKILPEIVPSM